MHTMPLLLSLLLLADPLAVSALGINYGRVGDDLPAPSSVLPLLCSLRATSVKLYDADPDVLHALSTAPFDLVVGVPDADLPRLANSTPAALSLLNSSIPTSAPVSAITVGNEVLTNPLLDPHHLLPAMLSLHSALSSLPLRRNVSITTAHSLAILATSFPPSSATFRPALLPYLRPLLGFLLSTASPFLVNAYPYFAYKADPDRVDLSYALSDPNPGVVDPGTGLRYRSMLHAQVDAVHAAIADAVGDEMARGIQVRVSETGWPSKGDSDEPGATLDNARRYNENLIRMVEEGKGTPMRPRRPLEVYVFALFNEDQKPGPTSERNYGLFWPDGKPVYRLDVGIEANTSNGDGNGSRSGNDGLVLSPTVPWADGGLQQISSGVKVELFSRLAHGALKLVVLWASWGLALWR